MPTRTGKFVALQPRQFCGVGCREQVLGIGPGTIGSTPAQGGVRIGLVSAGVALAVFGLLRVATGPDSALRRYALPVGVVVGSGVGAAMSRDWIGLAVTAAFYAGVRVVEAATASRPGTPASERA